MWYCIKYSPDVSWNKALPYFSAVVWRYTTGPTVKLFFIEIHPQLEETLLRHLMLMPKPSGDVRQNQGAPQTTRKHCGSPLGLSVGLFFFNLSVCGCVPGLGGPFFTKTYQSHFDWQWPACSARLWVQAFCLSSRERWRLAADDLDEEVVSGSCIADLSPHAYKNHSWQQDDVCFNHSKQRWWGKRHTCCFYQPHIGNGWRRTYSGWFNNLKIQSPKSQ